jgi:hypothetical protein
MHNCKTTRELLSELVLDGSHLPAPLSTELRECAECREEFRALKETLRLTTQLIETATPPNNYWPGYHARLREKLHAAQHPHVEPGRSQHQSWLVRFFVSSIRIPVPVGLALLAIFGFLIFKARLAPAPAEPAIVHVPVEVPVPVIQEKTVERVVYRDRERPSMRTRRGPAPSRNESVLATLEGFEPAEEARLTVIKGSRK